MTTGNMLCPRCRGVKTVRGMGGVIRDCNRCEGSGYIKEDVVSDALVAIEAKTIMADKSDVTPTAEVVITPEIKPSVEVVGEAPVEVVKPAKPIEQELGEMAGYTPLMIEAIMREPSMKPDAWRAKYASVICNPLAIPRPGVQYLPDLQSRARFREGVGRSQKPAKRKHDTMKTHDLAGKLEGLE